MAELRLGRDLGQTEMRSHWPPPPQPHCVHGQDLVTLLGRGHQDQDLPQKLPSGTEVWAWGCSRLGLEGHCSLAPSPPYDLGTSPSAGGARVGTHGAACAALSLGALRQLRSTAPVLAEQSLHAVDDVPDAVDEAVPLRLEDELVVDLVGGCRSCSAPSRARQTPTPTPALAPRSP